ncbi:MAG: TPM domain-containing protein [Clostridia bacterium]|nr:TPM domain-containing protein [Clostridia bacterium]
MIRTYPINAQAELRALNELDLADIKQAVLIAELDTSCEIVVHVEDVCSGDVMERASEVFLQKVGHKTVNHNGVLFYLALRNRKFAVISDTAITQTTSPRFWEALKLEMLDYFRENNFTNGLIYGIGRTGQYLKSFFPYQHNDINELPDEVSMG